MKKNYNYTRRKLYLPEYGRHIQEMIDSLLAIEDRRERNRQARAVIAVMGNLNPLLRDTADFTHKLWDHLFIMSDFQLDVDSPYPQPSRQELTASPRRMSYSQGRITYKHYGKYVERMIRGLADERNPRTVSRTVDNLARYMRTKSYEYNQEHPSNEVIVKDIKRMSGGAIQIDEVALNNLRSDYKQHFSARPQKGAQQGRQPYQQRRQQQRRRVPLPHRHPRPRDSHTPQDRRYDAPAIYRKALRAGQVKSQYTKGRLNAAPFTCRELLHIKKRLANREPIAFTLRTFPCPGRP